MGNIMMNGHVENFNKQNFDKPHCYVCDDTHANFSYVWNGYSYDNLDGKNIDSKTEFIKSVKISVHKSFVL